MMPRSSCLGAMDRSLGTLVVSQPGVAKEQNEDVGCSTDRRNLSVGVACRSNPSNSVHGTVSLAYACDDEGAYWWLVGVFL